MRERSLNFLKLLDRYAGIPTLYLLAGIRALLSILFPPRTVRVRTIVMVKLWGVGNLVMIIPMIRAVRQAFPDARIHFLTIDRNAEFLETLPDLDSIITLKSRGALTSLLDLIHLPFKLVGLRPDLYLDFEQFLRVTAIIGLLSGAPQRVGLKTPGQARAKLYNIKVPYRLDRHMTLTFGDVVRSAGVDTSGYPSLEVPRSVDAAARVDTLLADWDQTEGPLVAMHPGSGDNFPARRWPIENFAHVARRLHDEAGARIVLTGTAPELTLADRFRRISTAPALCLMSQLTLLELVEFLSRVDLLITNDTAPVHIGSALRLRLIALYGPNTPDLYGPLNDEARPFYLRFPCSPCITNLNAKTSSCQLPTCILSIDPDRVADAAIGLLPTGQDSAVLSRKADQ